MKEEKNLRREWVIKYAEIKKIDKNVLLLLFKDNILSSSSLKAKLIKYDFNLLKLNGDLSRTDIKVLLANRYEVSASHVETIVYNKKTNTPKKAYHCFQCEAEITKYKDEKNKGLCDTCVSKNESEHLFHAKFR